MWRTPSSRRSWAPVPTSARQAREREPDDAAAPILAGRARLPDRLGARRAGRQISCRPRPAGRTPNLLIVSTNGAGYDTVERQGLHRGRRAGGQPVRRQPRGGRRARARDDADAVEAHHRDRPRACAARRHNRNIYMGHDVHRQDHRHRRPRQCRQAASRSCAAACSRMQVLAYDPYLSGEEIARRGAKKVELDDADAPRPTSSRSTARSPTETRGMIGARSTR